MLAEFRLRDFGVHSFATLCTVAANETLKVELRCVSWL